MMGWLLTFTTSATLYFIMTWFMKPQVFPTGSESAYLKWEWLANEGREGFFEGEKEGGEIYASATPPMTDGEEVQIGEKSSKVSV